jgi:hypothetical protein
MGGFITRVLVNFYESLMHFICRKINTHDCLMRVKFDNSQCSYLTELL